MFGCIAAGRLVNMQLLAYLHKAYFLLGPDKLTTSRRESICI